jgi:hypothetical protein
MCDNPRRLFEFLAPRPTEPASALPAWRASRGACPPVADGDRGSRRPRIWELDATAHCPVVGVCLPIPTLHQLAERLLPRGAWADEYELHCMVVSACRQRGGLAEAVQKDLDRRHQLAVKQAARCKDSDALAAWWREACAGPRLAEALWATLTHPRCSPDLAYKVLGFVHMVQHQVGAATRVDQGRFDALQAAHAALQRAHQVTQDRLQAQSDRQGRRIDALEQTVLRLRADLISRDTELAQLREERDRLAVAQPDLPSREALLRERQVQTERMQALQRQVHRLSEQAQRLSERALAAEGARTDAPVSPPGEPDGPAGASPLQWVPREALVDRAVLCVGGRPASVPAYRDLVEQTGGRFLHHDGGEEDNPQRLDATLAAADLVVCQTGCISHGAYWRVKAHCKRTGKPCLFVDTPSRAALARALQAACAEANTLQAT